jgi:hypothetical protein
MTDTPSPMGRDQPSHQLVDPFAAGPKEKAA